MHHFLVGAPATGSQLAFHWSLRANRLPGPKDFFRIVTSEALLASSPFTQSGGCEYQEIAFAVCADGQFDDARCNITLVTSFTMAAGNTVNYARVTDFRCEATGQISGVVARETAKQIPSESFKSKGYSHRATRSSSRDGLTRCRRPRALASLLILVT